MKRYKAIFDLPDNLVPPTSIGFQVITPTNLPFPNHCKVDTYTTLLMPMSNCSDIEDGVCLEIIKEE